jgi:isoleucyl-tRNA synthetase
MEIKLPNFEKEILNFWEKNRIFEKSLKGKKNFVFYEGPPTQNGRPGIHHFLARCFKDAVCRFKTMQGFLVLRKAGWDTHGLPIEIEVEKKLNIKNKKEIEERIGIEKFVKECKKNVFAYKNEWEKFTKRMGYWIDLENPYITCSKEYMESVLFILKNLWEKGLLYEDFKVVPYCPRCQTALSSHEVAQGYKRIKENSIYVKFKVLNPEFENTFLLVWTTTPWTLPGNVAVAVNPNFVYVKAKKGNESFILAKEKIFLLGEGAQIEKDFLGKDLEGIKYEAPFPPENIKNSFKVVLADFVNLEYGTGLVHIAPAFGEEDFELIKTYNARATTNEEKFPIIVNVDEEGKFKNEVKKFAGLFVKDADPKIIEDLKDRGILLKEELYEHDYPFCWRCKTPLLYYAKKSWFIRVTKIKEKLLEENKKINWVPQFLREGRFGEWLKEVQDWALSRERYFGIPLPIWRCKNCSHLEVIGSKNHLLKQKFSKNEYFILRHGEALSNKKDILITKIPEKISSPLTKRGEKEVREAVKKLKNKKIDLIFSSDFERTKQTAEIVAKELGLKVIYDKRLREINVGIFDGKKLKDWEEFFENYKEKFTKKIKGGENYNQVKIRMYRFLEDLERKYQGKKILIVSHQRPLTMLEGAVKGFEIEDFEKFEKKKIKTGEIRKIEFKSLPYNEEGEIDFHRPFIDKVKFLCPKCGSFLERVKEVIDVWFDSGAMPFAQVHWPFACAQSQISNLKSQNYKKLVPPKLFPADFICEGMDQTRGWFYSLLAVSTLLGFGTSYKNVLTIGIVLDEKGEKMSKSRGNIVDPFYLMEKYGSDILRWYFYTINQPWEEKRFSEKEVFEKMKNFVLTLWNCFTFYKTYAEKKINLKNRSVKNVLDKWIISRLNKLIFEVTQDLEKFSLTPSARKIENFVIEDLSLWYIRRSRRRFQEPKEKKELIEAQKTLGFVLVSLSKILAPFLPFLSEKIYQEIENSKKSVHLENWPKANLKDVNENLEKEMEKARKIAAEILRKRQEMKIKVRQPLKKAILNERLPKEILEVVKEETNIKEIIFGENFEIDFKVDQELKEEGMFNEVLRNVQEMRKKRKLLPKDKVKVKVFGEEKLISVIKKYQKDFQRKSKIKEIQFVKLKKIPKSFEKFSIENSEIYLKMEK